ncbi:MAG: DNA topoisomerase (ATP-hydrolyzing) subunit B [Patescibacteria group bacterium]
MIKKQTNKPYDADAITVLEGLAPVRKRPGMYIGATSSTGLHHLIWEVVDNGIDEAMAGEANEIDIILLANDTVQISDNGRGIPVDKHKATGVSALETVLTKLHAGGKFGEGGGYKVSGGLHGVGVSVVNALSEYLKAEIYREGKIWMQEYKCGKPLKAIKSVGKTNKTGTVITFKPDPTIFKEGTEFNWGKILDRMRQQAYLTQGIVIKLSDCRKNHKQKNYKFYFEGGIKSYIQNLNENKTIKNETIFYVNKEINDTNVEIALQYNDEFNENVLPFTNNIYNPEGGTHLIGFKTALTRTLNAYAKNNNLIKDKDNTLTGEDVREGLTTIISIKVIEPQFEGQTKGKLGNAEVKTHVEQIFGSSLLTFLEEHPKEAEAIINKCVISAQARIAARTARTAILRKGALEGMTLPGKLADCSNRKSEESELYIVEGDSAGGCFDGNTKVMLADGRNISFKKLAEEEKEGKKNYCYTINQYGNIEIGLIENPRITKKNVEVIKVILDNNKKIICTPDHKFMLRNGDYCKADKLKNNASLMPLRKKISKIIGRITIAGYEMVYDTLKDKWIFTHMLVDNYNIKMGKYIKNGMEHKHHIDFNKLNNNPNNIKRLSREQHLKLHTEMLSKTLHREDVKQKCKKIHQTPEFKKKISEIMLSPKMNKILSERAKKQWQDKKYKEYMIQKYKEFYNSNENYRKENLERLNKAQKKYWAKTTNKEIQSQKVKKFYKNNPEFKKILSEIAKKQWDNPELKKWRSNKTKEQWIDNFRDNRKKAYNQTYFRHTISFMKQILENYGNINKYNEKRIKSKNKNLLKKETFTERFFNNNKNVMLEAVKNYNHKIKKIIKLDKKIDVYDLEVKGTHNFALATGVFVHNSAKQGRDRKFQAILPLRGKILNTERARIDKILSNNEIKNLIIALGTNISDQFNIDKLRYNRIIIMTDADVDGAHIKTLLLTLFFRHFNPLIVSGHLYIAQPPLYQIKKGAVAKYAYTDKEKDIIINELGGINSEEEKNTSDQENGADQPNAGMKNINIQRYKGLGEMNPEQLWETTMDPKNRITKQVTIEDAALADKTFDTLMGNDVAPRKHFIQTHAQKVKNLDI